MAAIQFMLQIDQSRGQTNISPSFSDAPLSSLSPLTNTVPSNRRNSEIEPLTEMRSKTHRRDRF
jgi:hypothetical protein